MRIIAACMLLAGAALPAVAQERTGLPAVGADATYRDGLPRVEARKPEADPDADQNRTLADFRAWNKAKGRPRLLLFWDRQLSDDTTTRYRDRAKGVVATAVEPGVAVTAYDRVRETERTTGGTVGDLHPRDSSIYESGYVSAFLRAGANIVDRNALMRKVSTKRAADDRSDQQFIESLALEQGVEYLVEVVPEYSGAETGYTFTVKVTHLPTSSLRAQFQTDAQPASGPERLVARPGGFRRERDSRITPDRVAETLAAETMQRLL